MDIFATLNVWDLLFNLKQFVSQAIAIYHNYVYVILFFIVFMETGFVVTPFLPGDSLLFTAGVFASAVGAKLCTPPLANPPLDLAILLPVMCLAPICGDSVNYWIGAA